MTYDEQLDEWRWKEAQKASVGEVFGPEYTRAIAREYHRLIATDARPVEDEAERVWYQAYTEICKTRPELNGHKKPIEIIRAALDKVRSEATARAEKAEWERDAANVTLQNVRLYEQRY